MSDGVLALVLEKEVADTSVGPRKHLVDQIFCQNRLAAAGVYRDQERPRVLPEPLFEVVVSDVPLAGIFHSVFHAVFVPLIRDILGPFSQAKLLVALLLVG